MELSGKEDQTRGKLNKGNLSVEVKREGGIKISV